MDEIKNTNGVEDASAVVNTDSKIEDTAAAGEIPGDAPEEILEVVLSGDEEGEAEAPSATAESDEYYELSGLTEGQRRRKMIWDKVTTGILIALLASPIAILAYIFLWFIFK